MRFSFIFYQRIWSQLSSLAGTGSGNRSAGSRLRYQTVKWKDRGGTHMIFQRICLKWIYSRVIHALVLAPWYTTPTFRHAHHHTSLQTRRWTLGFSMYCRWDTKCPKPVICCIVEIKQLIFDLGWVQRDEITSRTIQEVFWVSVNDPTTMEYPWILYFRDIAQGCWTPYLRRVVRVTYTAVI